MDLNPRMRFVFLIIVALFVSGCSPENVRDFDIRNLAKSDIDMVADTHRKELEKQIRKLTIKLYKRNPRELAKTPRMTIDLRVQQILAPPPAEGYPELEGRSGAKAMSLALTESYQGDRVFALMAGVHSMIDASFNHKREFFLLDELDQQKLYNSARNLETVAWNLNNRKDQRGQLLLLSNGYSKEGIPNLSFERTLGKMIALQDMLALIIADTTNRTIKNVVHRAASFTFLPI
ncbi:hypothetical protein [Pontibacterium sp.]|uniref:hypothetical protein n=2 Tax=Pontibacterium sp. TaxID=2036026 RepID=UPI0035187C95